MSDTIEPTEAESDTIDEILSSAFRSVERGETDGKAIKSLRAHVARELTAAQAEIAGLREKCDKLAEWCMDLRGEWQWKKDEPRAGNKAEYDALCADIDSALALRKANPGGAHD